MPVPDYIALDDVVDPTNIHVDEHQTRNEDENDEECSLIGESNTASLESIYKAISPKVLFGKGLTALGLNMALGVIYVEMIDALKAPRSEAALVQSIYMGISLGGGILFSRIIGRFDVGKCVICSSIIGTLCLIVSSFARNLGVIIVLVGFVLGISQSFNLLSSYAVINWSFSSSRRSALACLTIGQALAMLSDPFITEALVERYSWQDTFLILGALMPLNGVPVGILMQTSSRYFAKDDAIGTENEYRRDPMYKELPFILYLSAHVAFAAPGSVGLWFTVDLAVMKGFTTHDGATLLFASGIFRLIGRCSGTILLHTWQRLAPEILLAASFLVWAIAHALVVNTAVLRIMFLAMILRGFSGGHINSILPAMQIELRGVQLLPESVALSSCLAGSTQILFGFLGGYSVDVTGSYTLIYLLAAGSAVYSLFSIVIVLILRKLKAGQQKYERINS